jgi:hypothetical protein
MSEGYIFWREPLRVAGPRPQAEALARLQTILTGRGGGLPVVGQRLVGSIRGAPNAPEIALWRRSPLAAAGDRIEFRGTLRAEGETSAFEGTLAYAFGTKLQFVSMLVAGVVVLATNAVRLLSGSAHDHSMLLLGAMITGAALVWIYSSSRTRDDQIRFIERHLESCVSGEQPRSERES